MGFQMSPYLQELVAFTGQNHVYEEASEQLAKSNLLSVNAKQVERITNAYGLLSEHYSTEIQENRLKEKYATDDNSPLYCMMDGSMIQTREDNWKEVKLCRLFSERDELQLSKGRKELRDSEYIGHIGGVGGFFKKLDGMADHLQNAVFIADGAKWIWNFVEDHYPDSTQILDFFHSKEKLCDFAKLAINENDKRSDWIDTQSNLLLDDRVEEVIENIQAYATQGRTASQNKRTLLTYYENNSCRMKYKTYQEKGLLMGSGAMESAHRTIIQSRMKRSGQRWSIRGAQNVLNLRTLNKSGHWDLVKNIILN